MKSKTTLFALALGLATSMVAQATVKLESPSLIRVSGGQAEFLAAAVEAEGIRRTVGLESSTYEVKHLHCAKGACEYEKDGKTVSASGAFSSAIVDFLSHALPGETSEWTFEQLSCGHYSPGGPSFFASCQFFDESISRLTAKQVTVEGEPARELAGVLGKRDVAVKDPTNGRSLAFHCKDGSCEIQGYPLALIVEDRGTRLEGSVTGEGARQLFTAIGEKPFLSSDHSTLLDCRLEQFSQHCELKLFLK